MRLSKILFGLLITCMVAASCTRKNDVIFPPDPPTGGKGGMAKLRVTPRHHGENIDSCTIKLAYDATNFPQKGWDEVKSVSMIDGKPTAVFDSLAPGKYFLYAEGYDPFAETTNGPVWVYGSGPFTIIDSFSTYDMYIDVNENIDHTHTPQH